MWYGRLATRSYGALTRSVSRHVEHVAFDELEADPRRSRLPNRVAQMADQARIDFDRRHRGAARRAGRRSGCRVRARSRGPGALDLSSARSTMSSSTWPSTRWFWLRRLAAPSARGAADSARPSRPKGRCGSSSSDSWSSGGRHGELERRLGREIVCRRARPPEPGRSPPRRSSRRCPCTAPAAARRVGCRALRASLSMRVAQDAVRGHSPADDDRPRADLLGRAQRLRRQHVDDRLLEPVGQLATRRSPAGRGRRAHLVDRSMPSSRATSRRAAVLRPLNEKSNVSPIHARGNGRSCCVRTGCRAS